MTIPRFFIVFVASLVALGPFSIDTYLPALPQMAEVFGVSIVSVNHTLSIYLLGFSVGQMFGGPISDQIGRKTVGLFGLTIFTVTSLAISAANDVATVMWLRGIQALGGGCATVICMAMVRDAYPPDEAARMFPRVMLVMLSAPLLAPAIGAILLPFGWWSIFVFLCVYGALMMGWFVTMPETASQRSGRLALGSILPQYIKVLTFRKDGLYITPRWIFSQGLITSLMFIFITHSAFIYLEYFQVGPQWFVVFFGANVAAMMVGTLIASRLVMRFEPFTLYQAARAVQFTSIALLTLCTLLTAIPIWVFTPLLAIGFGCNGVINPSVQGMYLAPFGQLAGSATSLMSMAMFSFGAGLGLASGLFYDGTLVPIVVTMMGVITLGNLVAFTIPRQKLMSD